MESAARNSFTSLSNLCLNKTADFHENRSVTQVFVKNSCARFYKIPTNDSVSRNRSQTDGRAWSRQKLFLSLLATDVSSYKQQSYAAPFSDTTRRALSPSQSSI